MPDTRQPTPDNLPVIRMEKITKRFPGIVANRDVDLTVQAGSFHAVIGENGAGKSTLLNILYGRYRPDGGRIFLQGEEVTQALRSPSDAIARGLGLVSQHYALIPALTVLENTILGAEPTHPGGALNRRQAEARIITLAEQLGLDRLDFAQRAERLSVAAGQKVEILKALYRGARILLLDEPTATLAPQEADSLFELLRTLQSNGTTIIFVTHKLREVMTYSQAVTVLRAGSSVAHFQTTETNEAELLRQMIGPRKAGEHSHHPPVARDTETRREEDRSQKSEDRRNPTLSSLTMVSEGHEAEGSTAKEFIPSPDSSLPISDSTPLLQITNVSVRNARRALAVQSVSLQVHAGEIVGIAGVDGSGQRELSEAIIGLRPLAAGSMSLQTGDGQGYDLSRCSVRKRQKLGIAYIPEDRHRAGMILDFSIAENYLLGHEENSAWGGGFLLHPRNLLARAAAMIRDYDVRVGQKDANFAASTLSGGNQQKVVIARAMDSAPRLLVACQPTRGLDVEASRFVYETLRAARSRGLGVLLFSLDLDEVLEMSDRIAVMFNGHIAGILPRGEATPELVGALMTGSEQKPDNRADNLYSKQEERDPTGEAPGQSKIENRKSKISDGESGP